MDGNQRHHISRDTNISGETNIELQYHFIEVNGEALKTKDVFRIATEQLKITLPATHQFRSTIDRSFKMVSEAVQTGQAIYGVTTLFGGMANLKVAPEDSAKLQEHLLIAHDASFGPVLPPHYVKAAMLIRLNSLCRGYSGISWEILERIVVCVNEDFIPQVRKYGSIGASGDLVPLATVAGSITGIFPSTAVLLNNETMTSEQALNKLGLKKIHLNPKEGLALINGTSMMAGIAAIIMERTNALIKLSLSIQAIMIQSLKGTSEYFHEDLHQHKPHRGQAWVAKIMSALLEGSLSITATTLLRNSKIPDDLIQDRYSIRCLPQFLGPIIEGLNDIQQQIDVEINSTTDNPLVDAEKKKFYHGGHFLGQYLSMGMDRLRHMLALSAKHLDTQIALLMTPEFSHGLPPSLSCDSSGLGVGCKALQIGGNSIVPLLEHRGMPLADRFPTYAEQFNQNVNSQGMGACLLADESLDLYRRYLVITLIISTQAIDLRAQEMQKGPQGAAILSEKTQPLHRSVRQLLLGNPDEDRPLIRSNKDQSFASWIQAITEDLNDHNGLILSSLPGFDPEYLA